MKNPTLHLTPLHQAIQAGPAQGLPCLLSLKADSIEMDAVRPRPQMNLAVVLDVSPSMSGPAIAQARAAAILLIDRLEATDRVALITYATTAQVLMASSLVGEARETARRLLSSVTTREHSTALHAGWLHGAQAIAGHVAPSVTSRILLLSDGNANAGEARQEVLWKETRRLLDEAGIATSTYGIGMQFNEHLMTGLGEHGGGQAFYANEAAELAGYFDTELNLLAGSVARQVSGSVHGPDEATITWVTGRTDAGGVRLSDLVSGATSWALAQVSVPPTEAGQALPITATAKWTDTDGTSHEATVTIQVQVQAEADAEDLTVAERVREAEASNLQRQAHHHVSTGNMAGAQAILRSMTAMAGSNAYVGAVAENLNALFDAGNVDVLKKEMAFSSYAMTSRQVSNDEDTTTLSVDRLGLRKSVQGRAVPTAEKGP